MPQRLNDCLKMGMGRNGNVKSHSRSSLMWNPSLGTDGRDEPKTCGQHRDITTTGDH